MPISNNLSKPAILLKYYVTGAMKRYKLGRLQISRNLLKTAFVRNRLKKAYRNLH